MDFRRLALISAGLAIALAAGFSAFLLFITLTEERKMVGVVSSGDAVPIGGPFTLVDHEGRSASASDFRGRHMLVYFGYSSCPDVCSIALQIISEALDQLGQDGARVQPIFITIDPERDTPEVLADYRQNFHPDLVALTGTVAQVRDAAKAFYVYVAKTGDVDSEDYLMEHSSFAFLMDRQGRYVAHFSFLMEPKEMARRIREAF